MTFFDKITGNDMNREFKAMDARIAQLPAEYQACWQQIFAKISIHSDFTGRNLMPILAGIVDMLEEMNSLGKTVDEIFGGDLDTFCDELTQDEPSFDPRDKWRKQLNDKIEKKFK